MRIVLHHDSGNSSLATRRGLLLFALLLSLALLLRLAATATATSSLLLLLLLVAALPHHAVIAVQKEHALPPVHEVLDDWRAHCVFLQLVLYGFEDLAHGVFFTSSSSTITSSRSSSLCLSSQREQV